jgi:hypothetical protein
LSIQTGGVSGAAWESIEAWLTNSLTTLEEPFSASLCVLEASLLDDFDFDFDSGLGFDSVFDFDDSVFGFDGSVFDFDESDFVRDDVRGWDMAGCGRG